MNTNIFSILFLWKCNFRFYQTITNTQKRENSIHLTMIRYVTKYSRKITARSPSLFCLSLTLLSILEMSFLLLSSPWLTNHVMRTKQNYLDMSNFSLQELEFLWNTKLVIWKCAILFWIEQNVTKKSRSLFKKSRYERLCDLKNCFKQKISKQINACMKSVLTKLSMLCTILSIYIYLFNFLF